MANITIAHISDAHLWQKLDVESALRGSKMTYSIENGQNESRLKCILSDIERRRITRVIFGGDIGAKGSIVPFFEELRKYNFSVSIVPGNHDAYANIKDFCTAMAGLGEDKLYSSSTIAGHRLILLDSADGRIGKQQLNWLSSELDSLDAVTLFVHHPILEIDTPIDRSGAALIDRDDVRRILIESDCETRIFCGHYHMDYETREANIVQHITPAICYQISHDPSQIKFDTHRFGYRIIGMRDGEMRTDVVTFGE